MKPHAHQALSIALQTGIPTLLIGAPGGGKTSTVQALAATLSCPLHTLIGSIIDPTDLSGIPYRGERGMEFAPPRWVCDLQRATTGFPSSILFLDELSTAPPPVQAGMLRVLHERVVGGEALPSSCALIAAMNPPEQAPGGLDLAPPLANRLLHLSYTITSEEWTEGLVSGFPAPSFPLLPSTWETHLPTARGLVSGYVRANPHHLSSCPTDPKKAGGAWPSPRTWDYLSRTLAGAQSMGAGEDTELTLAGGLVGEGVATAFLSYKQNADLPDPEEVLKRGAKFKLPARTDLHYAILGAMVGAILGKWTEARVRSGLAVLNTAHKEGAIAVSTAMIRPLWRKLGEDALKNAELSEALIGEYPFLQDTLRLFQEIREKGRNL